MLKWPAKVAKKMAKRLAEREKRVATKLAPVSESETSLFKKLHYFEQKFFALNARITEATVVVHTVTVPPINTHKLHFERFCSKIAHL